MAEEKLTLNSYVNHAKEWMNDQPNANAKMLYYL